MPLEIDGFAVFGRIGSHRAVFAGVAADIDKSARSLVVKLIKDKNTGLATLRDIRSALGAESFNLIADGMSDAEIKSITAKLDKNNAELKTADSAWQRRHLVSLADGSLGPAEKQKSAPKPEKAKKPKAPPKTVERISFSSAGATRKR
jgi:hypothetical protein